MGDKLKMKLFGVGVKKYGNNMEIRLSVLKNDIGANEFYKKNKIPLDPIYTGKMFFGVIDLIQKNYFPAESKILLIHTGGIQGIQGMNMKLRNKQLPTININV